MFKEPRWIAATKTAKKIHIVLETRDNEILVMLPAKVSKYDNHVEHIVAHTEYLRQYGVSLPELQPVMDHIYAHMRMIS